MNFEVISFSDKASWKKIVQNKEIYYQWEYVDAFYKNEEGIPYLAYAKNNDNYVFNVFLKRDVTTDEALKNEIEKDKYFDIITPYGYGGVDIAGEKDEDLLKYFFSEFEKYCKNNNIISEFLRLNPLADNYELYNNTDYQILNISKTVHIKLENEEQIWNDMKSECRNTIRKAQKNNVIVKSGFSKEMLDEFIDLYNKTMKRLNATNYYFFSKVFFDSIYNNMKNNALIYTAYYNEKPINSLIVIYNGENANYHLSGSDPDYMSLGANNLSLYEAAKELCEKGYKKFHLGGGYGGDNSPLLKFKKSFNKNGELNFYIGKKVWNKETYSKLCKIKNVSENENFFPAYRK